MTSILSLGFLNIQPLCKPEASEPSDFIGVRFQSSTHCLTIGALLHLSMNLFWGFVPGILECFCRETRLAREAQSPDLLTCPQNQLIVVHSSSFPPIVCVSDFDHYVA